MLKTEHRIEEVALGTNIEMLFQYSPTQEQWREKEAISQFLGENSNGEFRIPAADNGQEVFFNNREMLARFASMPKPTQEAFLQGVRSAMTRQAVKHIQLEVQWSPRKTRVIRISSISIGPEGPMDIFI